MSEKQNWFARLKQGLGKSSSQIVEGVAGIFTKRKLDAQTLQDLEDLLIQSDIGAKTAAMLCEKLRKERFD